MFRTFWKSAVSFGKYFSENLIIENLICEPVINNKSYGIIVNKNYGESDIPKYGKFVVGFFFSWKFKVESDCFFYAGKL